MEKIIDRRPTTSEENNESTPGFVEIVKVGDTGLKHAVVGYVVRKNIGGKITPIPNPNGSEDNPNFCHSLLEARTVAGLLKVANTPKTKSKAQHAAELGKKSK